ncbi:glutathione synthase [Gammaproteobacteria bacterium]|nr:glutathione synthase [Gammaproteobacteria bacterium]
MSINWGFILDPWDDLDPAKDSSLVMIQWALEHDIQVWVTQMSQLASDGKQVIASWRPVDLLTTGLGHLSVLPCQQMHQILIRKDPPVDACYLHGLRLLQQTQMPGRIWNKPESLLRFNEKLGLLAFGQWSPKTLVSGDFNQLIDWIKQLGDVVVKPLDGMGGFGILRLKADDMNVKSALTLLLKDHPFIMIQPYLPASQQGDKRIILLDGKPMKEAVLRVPATDDLRGNLAQGATAKVVELTDRERAMCTEIGPVLYQMGLRWVGLDVIGDYLTEINVTSPTCLVPIIESGGGKQFWQWLSLLRKQSLELTEDLI